MASNDPRVPKKSASVKKARSHSRASMKKQEASNENRHRQQELFDTPNRTGPGETSETVVGATYSRR